MENQSSKEQKANDFTNVKDIKDIFLYTKDNFIMCYLQVYPLNIDLMTKEDLKAKTEHFTSTFKDDRKKFVYFTLPREIDLDQYKNELKEIYNDEMANPGRKRILREMILECVELSSNEENYEHQHFIKIWGKIGLHKEDTERELKERIEEFKTRYLMNEITVEIIKGQKILKMCNLFSNAIQAPYEMLGQGSFYETPICLL